VRVLIDGNIRYAVAGLSTDPAVLELAATQMSTFLATLARYPDITCIIHDADRLGAARLARDYALDNKIARVTFRAGKGGRNDRMLCEGAPDLVLVFGLQDACTQALVLQAWGCGINVVEVK
jgi:hypothetical protein